MLKFFEFLFFENLRKSSESVASSHG